MYDYVIVHGSYGHPFENWFPWLFEKLSADGKNVLAPQFPCGKGYQNYENWEKVLNAYKTMIDENTTFIGHSLSPAFIVDYLIKNMLKVKKLVCVAPFYGAINIPDFDEVNNPFFILSDTNVQGITCLAEKRICFISKTDPYVPNELSLEFANRMKAEIIMVDNAGHFNKSAGYSSFEQLYNIL